MTRAQELSQMDRMLGVSESDFGNWVISSLLQGTWSDIKRGKLFGVVKARYSNGGAKKYIIETLKLPENLFKTLQHYERMFLKFLELKPEIQETVKDEELLYAMLRSHATGQTVEQEITNGRRVAVSTGPRPQVQVNPKRNLATDLHPSMASRFGTSFFGAKERVNKYAYVADMCERAKLIGFWIKGFPVDVPHGWYDLQIKRYANIDPELVGQLRALKQWLPPLPRLREEIKHDENVEVTIHAEEGTNITE